MGGEKEVWVVRRRVVFSEKCVWWVVRRQCCGWTEGVVCCEKEVWWVVRRRMVGNEKKMWCMVRKFHVWLVGCVVGGEKDCGG